MAAKSKMTAAKSRPQMKEETEEWLDCKTEEDFRAFQVFIGDNEDETMDTTDYKALSVRCTLCRRGTCTLHHLTTERSFPDLIWKCDFDLCTIRWSNLDATTRPALGVLLCPQCQKMPMHPIEVPMDDSESNTEVQCMGDQCNMAMYMFEIPLVYSKTNFNLRLLQPSG